MDLAWRDPDGRLCVCSSDDARNWGSDIALREYSRFTPALATLGDALVWAWAAADRQDKLCTLSYDLWMPELEERFGARL